MTLSVESVIEVICLFAVAVMVSWPALKRYLPERAGATAAKSSNPQRYVPKSSEAEAAEEDGDAFLGHMNGTGIGAADYADEEDEDQVDGVPERGVLPLAEALLRGERVSAQNVAAKRASAKTAADLFPPVTTSNGIEPTPAPKDVRTILLAESRDKVRTAMLLRLARSGHRVFPVATGREAIDLFTRQRTDVVFINFDILKHCGADLVRRIRALAPFVPVLVSGAKSSAEHLDIDVTMIPHAGDDAELLAEMVECALAASRCLDRVRADQDVRGRILSELCYNLRSSLEVIHGYTDILHDEPDLSRFHDLIERVRASTKDASAQMQTYVDLSFLEIPNEEVRRDRVDLSSLEEKVERLVTRQIGDHPLRLTTSGPLQGAALVTDGDRLLAILTHVVTDAVRFTPTGEINIAVKALPDRTDFIVSDSGPGIGADVATPLPSANGSEYGISLAIAERLSRSIGASLTGACGEGGAASFTLSIPGRLMGPTTPQETGRTLH